MGHTSTYEQRTARRTVQLLLAFVLVLGAQRGQAQSVADLFDRADANTVGNGWSEQETTAPTSIVLVSGQLVMRSNSAGIDQVSRITTGDYDTELSANGCELSWSFNMRQTRNDPSGFDAGGFGAAVVLAGTDADLQQGMGYAVVLGTPGSAIDALRLVRYSGGLDANANLNQLVSAGDMNDSFIAVRVTYEPSSGLWTMYYSASASGPYADASEVTNLGGSAVDNTLAGLDLPYIGALWNHGSSSADRCRFDNLKVPFNCGTRVEFENNSFTASGGGGNLDVPILIANPHAVVNTKVDIVLISGNAARLSDFDGSDFTFNSPVETSKSLVLTLLEEGGCDGDEVLVFELQNISGGQTPAYIGPNSTFTLTITDPEVNAATLVEESFESDGSGSRYTLSTAHASPAMDSYFLRADQATLTAAGAVVISGLDGANCIGMEQLGGIGADSEVSVSFEDIDILGSSDITVALLAASRAAPNYDRGTDRDYMLVEANVDGAGWTLIGAFRPNGAPGASNRRLAQDTDLDGQGDGANMTGTMMPYAFDLATTGSLMDLRVRVRSTSAGEEIFFDHVLVTATQCRPVYYANGSGSTADPIWSTVRSGDIGAITLDRTVSLVVQDGFAVTADAGTFDVRNLTVETGGGLDLGDATLNVHGDQLHNSGTFISNGELRLVSSEQIAVTGTDTYALNDVTIDVNADVAMDADWDILGTLQLDNGGFDATDGLVILRSNASTTGRMGPVATTASYTGNLRMERYIPGGNTNWRLLGAPVSGAKVQQFQDDFYTAGYPGSHYPGFTDNGQLWPSVRWYDETHTGLDENDGMTGVSSNEQPLMPGQGFAAWSGDNLTTTAPFVVDLRGTPNIAHTPIELPMSWTDTGNPDVDGYNLVSNPLPSAIAFSSISLGADVDNGYSIFDPATGNMATWNGTMGTNGANGIIQSTQGFWLKASGPAVTTTVTEAAKVDDNDGGVFGGKSVMSLLRLRINSAINSFSDETLMLFHIGTPAFTDEDVPKFVFAHPQAPQIATQGETGQWIAINAYGQYASNIIIPLIVNVAVTGDYTITANEIQNLGLSCLRIEDMVTGIITPISQGATYTFNMAANDDPNTIRFRLHASAPLIMNAMSATCAGAGNGYATVELIDGPADVIWTDSLEAIIAQQTGMGPGAVTIDQLAVGEYGVRIEGLSGCAVMEKGFDIGEPTPMALEGQYANATCPGMSDGAVSAAVSGGNAPYTYLWSNGMTSANVTVPVGSYTVTVTDSLGCAIQGGPYVVEATTTPSAMATASMNTVPVYVPITLTSIGSNADSFLWDLGDGTTSTDADVEHTYTQPGNYQVQLNVWSGTCSADTVISVEVETSTGIADGTGVRANVWCGGDRIIVDHGFEGGSPVIIEIINAVGQLHAVHRLTATPARAEFTTDNMSAGLWFVRVSHDKAVRTFTIPLSGR